MLVDFFTILVAKRVETRMVCSKAVDRDNAYCESSSIDVACDHMVS